MLNMGRRSSRQCSLLYSLKKSFASELRGFARVAPPLPVILQKEVPNLGAAGTQVKVAQGFAHNYLIPNKLAIYDSGAKFGQGRHKKKSQTALDSENQGEAQAKGATSEQQELRQMMQQLLSQPLVVKRKARSGTGIEGHVTRHTVIDAIAKQHKIQMPPQLLEMESPILAHGIYDIPLGVNKPDGTQAMLEVLVKKPRNVRIRGQSAAS